jgi:hypothetical protein
MKTCIFILAMALVFVIAACVQNGGGRDTRTPVGDRVPSAEFIKAAIRHNEEAVSTLKADWTVDYEYHEAFKQLNPEYWEEMYDAQLVWAQLRGQYVRDSTGRYRLEMTTRCTSGRLLESLCGYDGSFFKFYDVMPKEPAFGQQGRISAKTQRLPLDPSPDRFAGYWIDNMRLSEYLERSKIKDIREAVDSAGRRFLEVDTIHFADANLMVRFRLDPEKGYCVTAIDTYIVNPPYLLISIQTTELKKIRKGTWYPAEGIMKAFNWVEERHKALETISYLLKVRSLEAGFAPKDEMFHIEFPKGTTVLDEIAGTSCHIGVAP